MALLVILFTQVTGKPTSYALFSGQNALPTLIHHAALFSAGALVLLIVCKGAAYGLSLSSFRGGPVFPGMFIGAALGIAVSHLPGLPMIAGVGMGIGAMTRGHARPAPGLGPSGLAAPVGRRDRVDAPHHRGRRGLLRALGAPEASARTRAGAGSSDLNATGRHLEVTAGGAAQPLSDRRRKVIVWSTGSSSLASSPSDDIRRP